jgi:hypothetical protein
MKKIQMQGDPALIAYEEQRKRAFSSVFASCWHSLNAAKRRGDTQAILKAARKVCAMSDSWLRLGRTLRAVGDQPPEIFWPVLLDNWSVCDGATEWHEMLPDIFRRKGSALPFMNEEATAFYNSLPDTITVYRGAAYKRIEGVSWTTDLERAKVFARGGRLGRQPEPVIATATISKTSPRLFFVDNSRSEFENRVQSERPQH